jgi:D-glycero-alpha-D-manno-heptose-7-phosphate kinase
MIVRSRAPLRLGLAGGGTDVSPYCDIYGGHVMNVTIDKHAYASIAASDDGHCHYAALDVGAEEMLACGQSPAPGGALQLLTGVHARIAKDYLGGEWRTLKVRTFSDAPPGSGLGSSSAMVVALVQAFAEYFSLPLGEYEVAHLAYDIERNDLKLAGGKQDQYAAAFGGFNFMEFSRHGHALVNPLRVRSWIVSELESSLVLCYTGQSRASAAIIAEQARNVQRNAPATVQAMLQAKQDAVRMKECLLRGNIREFGEVMRAAWDNKKRMASSISNQRLERFYDAAIAAGAYAGKVSGAGGGGFMMFLVDVKDRLNVVHALNQLGEGAVLGCHFTTSGAESWRPW